MEKNKDHLVSLDDLIVLISYLKHMKESSALNINR